MREDILVDKFHQLFNSGEYKNALVVSSSLLANDPDNLEYKAYPLICDMAVEYKERGELLYDYFIIEKEFDLENAYRHLLDLIDAFDGDNELMMKIIQDISKLDIESLNALDYDELKEIAKQRGSFKKAFEGIMFNTKIAIKNKQELKELIENLIESGYITMSYLYLDYFSNMLKYDKDLDILYKKIESFKEKRKDSENSK